MKEAKVYWAARNLSTWWNPLGNHHFILIETQVAQSGVSLINHKGVSFVTLGGFSINGFLTFQANDLSDVRSVKEKIDDLSWWKPDMGFAGHQIYPPNSSDLEFVRTLVRYSFNFEANSKVTRLPYELFGGNCSAWVNTLFKVAGISLKDRQKAGQFWGIDAGERIEIPEEMFTTRRPPYIPPHNPYPPNKPGYPGNGQRIHIVKRGDWLSKLAITYYGDMNKWPVIYNHPKNRETIGPDYNLIKPGQRLIIP